MRRYCDNCHLECYSTQRVGNDDVCETCFTEFLCGDLDELAMALNWIFDKPEAMEIAA